MSTYAPPFRRGRAEGSSSDVPSADHPPTALPAHNRPYNKGGDRGSRGYRGFRGGGRGGGYQGQQSRGPPVDEADLYHNRDIANHFFCGEDPHRSSGTRSTSFNDSAAHPGELSSNLNLLPGYTAKMLEHGPWDSPWDIHPGGTQSDALESHQKADKLVAGDPITNEAADRTIDNANVSTAEPTPPASSSSRKKHTDIPTIPAEEFENNGEQNVPTFPSIQPIHYIPSAHPPIAVFEERWNPWSPARDNSAHFAFGGWYKVAQVNLFAPHSAELMHMQLRKWERQNRSGQVRPRKNRTASVWNTVMGMQWAVVKFEKLADDVPPPPAIEKLPEPARRRPSDGKAAPKGVSGMLAELRMGDPNSSNGVGAHADGDEGPSGTEVPGKQEAPDGETPNLGVVRGEENFSMP
ncbi:hypothetical protein DL769_009666 [Monosporascus sp. CRB-8-3]|nr:hypothetical protein DL769_009666 [Monosporascus sp. CRB-8-3]